MTTNMEARRRMAKLLTTDAVQSRIANLNVRTGEFCADIIEAYAADERVSHLDEREALFVCEQAARLGLSVSLENGSARLTARNGHAALVVSVGALQSLCENRRTDIAV